MHRPIKTIVTLTAVFVEPFDDHEYHKALNKARKALGKYADKIFDKREVEFEDDGN